MFTRLASFVTRHRMLVVLGWLIAVVGVQSVAPRWEVIIHDGDFAYLPPYLPSVVGEQWMSEAFPRQRGKSQIVLAIVTRTRADDQRGRAGRLRRGAPDEESVRCRAAGRRRTPGR